MANGTSFADAKKQAHKEVLALFNVSKDTVAASETLDMSKDGEDNSILLAISAILQGYRTDAELSELLANLSDDLNVHGALSGPGNG